MRHFEVDDLGRPPTFRFAEDAWVVDAWAIFTHRSARPSARCVCSCGLKWEGGSAAIARAAEHLHSHVLVWRSPQDHRVTVTWTTTLVMRGRKVERSRRFFPQRATSETSQARLIPGDGSRPTNKPELAP